MFYWDKHAAIKKQWRISEFTLLLFAFCGSALGEYIGMKLFHHKNLKSKFKYGLPLMIFFNIICYGYLLIF